MKAEDVQGAVYVEWKDDAWLFAHCSPQQQIDFAASARTFAIEQFSLPIAKAGTKVDEATNAVIKSVAVTKKKALTAFAEAVGAHVHKTIVEATLGAYHRDPHQDHRRDLTVAAIDAVLAAWDEAGKTDKAVRDDRQAVGMPASDVRASLTTTHTIEWRHARVARLEAEKKAKEAEAETATPSDGDGS